uniref:Intraflagellar Transport Protein 81 putative n=1 Tax=Albugo laibachii Nc14 TaxID=890382 RepID=F0WE30_9STRA|nr:Intraflagellar Transport Protein 81 putative [Albugo laibachii Nc14]|eukprot:CCA19459.1 Intraflagellar Transport Protein 81 putative [Albugo laibachii Nc14]
MSELQFIVDHLKKDPFKLDLSLVGFDEKNNFELLQILNTVFVQIDSKHAVDLRVETDHDRTARMLEFLQLLRYPLPSSSGEIENFRDGLVQGDHGVVYPILHWALRNLAHHQKRAYLGKYLVSINVPQEFFMDQALAGLYDHFKNLQDEFKQVHKDVDQLRNARSRPGELRKEISQLEQESHQLDEKIATIKKKTASDDNFQAILKASSALRKEQEEQAKLYDRKREQMMALTNVEKRVNETEAKLLDLKRSLNQDTLPEELFDHLAKQVERNRNILMHQFPEEMRNQQENLQKLEKAFQEPPKSEADLREMDREIQSVGQSIERLQSDIFQAQKQSGDDKLAIFRQHASVQAKKLSEKEQQLGLLKQEKLKLMKQLENTERKVSEFSIAKGVKFMSREEFKQYANQLRNKTAQYKKLKAEAAEISTESVILHRTEHILKSKLSDLDQFLKKIETEKGVVGFLETKDKLDDISKKNAQLNEEKGETLEEISQIVKQINQTLQARKNELAPQIKQLREVRQRFQEIEQVYVEKKTQYENVALGMETERIKLEQECNAFQEDCLREENQYHALHCLTSIEKAKVEKLEQEIEFEKGNGKLLRDIKTFQDLYKQKIGQQEMLTKELRKQQKNLKANAQKFQVQCQQFQQLKTLLQCKLKIAQHELLQPQNTTTINETHANVLTIDS